MKVLIVDDDFFITTALKTILEADQEIQVCGSGKNGKEALSLYASLDPDILLEKAKSVLASYPAIQTFGKPAEYTVEITDIVWGATLTGVDAQTGAYQYVPSLFFRGDIQFQGPEGQFLFSQVPGTKNRLVLNALDGSILYTGLPE